MEAILIANYEDQNHAKSIVELMKSYAHDPMGGGEGLSEFASNNMVNELQKIDGAFSVLAFVEKQPVGLVNCLPGFSTFYCKPLLNIHDAIVKKDFRGLKLIQRMLTLVENEAKKTGCCKLTLEVLDGNEIAKSAYRRFGFGSYSLDPKMGGALFWEKVFTGL